MPFFISFNFYKILSTNNNNEKNRDIKIGWDITYMYIFIR